MTTLLVLLVCLLALFGAPVFACMSAIALIGATTLSYNVAHSLTAEFGGVLLNVQTLATGDVATTLSTIPLFTFAGYLMAESRTAQRLVDLARPSIGWVPGGLGLVTILTCALFTTFTGASGVTIVAIGGLLLPSLVKEGYSERFSLGLVTGTGSVGLLFPPALPLIVYGVIYALAAQSGSSSTGDSMQLISFSVEKFFLKAGIVPGFILLGALWLYCVYAAIKNKVPRTPFDLPAAGKAFVRALPELFIPVLVIVPLSMGWLVIPEAAAITALYVLLVETLLYRDIKLSRLPLIARESMGLVGAIFMVIVGATALTGYFVSARVPDRLYEWMEAYIHSKWTFLLALNGLLLIVGSLMDIFSAIVVVVPLIAPAAMAYGVDPYHLGIIFLINLEIGYLTPPVGLNLFVTSFRFNRPIAEVVRASLPFLFIMLGVLMLVTYIPALVPVHDEKPASASEPTVTADAGPLSEIKLEDGGVFTPADCEQPEIKEDALGYAECKNKFILFEKCAAQTETLNKLECEQMAVDGKEFGVDEPDEDEDEDEAADDDEAAEEVEADAAP